MAQVREEALTELIEGITTVLIFSRSGLVSLDVGLHSVML